MRFHLRVSTRFKAPLEEVWALKTDPEKLRQEFQPWLHLSVADAPALAQALQGKGLPRTIDCRIWGLPWPIEVTECSPGARFCDRSENALFDLWEHEHRFEQASDAAFYLDAVTFTPRWGPPHLVARAVEALFVHRHRKAAQQLPTDQKATAVSMLRELIEVEEDGTEGFM